MPSRNVLKFDAPETYYHLYARGHSRSKIFLDDQDYKTFLKLLARYLTKELRKDSNGLPYPHLYGKLELLCYCLMPNHIHLFVYQEEEKAIQTLMRGLLTSYSRYFNKKYGRSGRYLKHAISHPW